MNRLAVGAIAAALAVASAGCGGPLHALSRHFSARVTEDYCAAAVPAALTAVGRSGSLVLVRPLPSREAAGVLASSNATPRACLVVFHGRYAAGQVAHAGATQSGDYALLVVRLSHPAVVRAWVTTDFDSHRPLELPHTVASP